MKFIISIILIAGILSCGTNNELEAPIQGLWCNDLSACIYFDGSNCMIDKFELVKFKCTKTELATQSKLGAIEKYQFEIIKDTLKLRQKGNEKFRAFIKTQNKNTITPKELYYSQLSEFSDFNFFVDKNGNYLLEINHHPVLDPAKYKGLVDEKFKSFLSNLINQMELNINNKFNSTIVSDIQEWGLKIHTQKGQEFKLYYNYSQVNKNHQNFANIMNFLPYFLNLEEGGFGNNLLDIQEFRKNEFDRNIKDMN